MFGLHNKNGDKTSKYFEQISLWSNLRSGWLKSSKLCNYKHSKEKLNAINKTTTKLDWSQRHVGGKNWFTV